MGTVKETLASRMTKPQIIRLVGSFVAISVVCFLAFECGAPLFMASFGASAVVIFAMPKSPAARIQNVIGGHIVSATVGVILVMILGLTWYTAALAAAIAIGLMVCLDFVHPPGGATALIAVIGMEDWTFILAPVAVGAIIMYAIGYVTNMACRKYEEEKS